MATNELVLLNRTASPIGLSSLFAFCVSTFVHLGLGLTLALIFIRPIGSKADVILGSLSSHEATNEVVEIEFAEVPQIPLSEVHEPDATEIADIGTAFELPSAAMTIASFPAAVPQSIGDLPTTGDFRSAIASEVTIASSTAGKWIEGTAAGTSTAGTGNSTSMGSKPEVVRSKSKATFFGAEADGNRFVFVIDSSSSMRGPRWDALCRELIRALQSLSPDQEYFIISFDSGPHPMFGLVPQKENFLNPTPFNVSSVLSWLLTFQHGGSTLPSSSIGIAMKLEPDAIFLLSDGEIADSTVQDLRFWNHKNEEDGKVKTLTPIHTVLLHSQVGFATLQTIARENSGTFTPVRAF